VSERVRVGGRIGPYQLLARLGDSSSGERFRAHDTRLGREVAVEVLRELTASSLVRERFRREAQAIAQLSHPNVLAIYDLGELDGLPYLVTELLQGETLRARLRRGAPSIAQAVRWTAQIALGLAAAHAQGIVHRDLKPESLFVVHDGTVKIVGFGLSPPTTPAGGRDAAAPPVPPGLASDAGQAPAISDGVLGPSGYLAPAQARGAQVTPAADLLALGATLYELLTGERAFPLGGADDKPPTLGRERLAPSSLRSEVPEALDRIVARCLHQEASARFESARDLAFALELVGGSDASGVPAAGTGAAAPPRRASSIAVAAALGAVSGAFAVAALRHSVGPSAPELPPRSFPITYSGRDRHPSVSPDGKFLAFTSDRDGRGRIWLHQLDIGREIALTDGPDSAPRFSPDGGEVLFTRTEGARSELLRVAVLGGAVRKVVSDASDGDWSPDGRRIVFVRSRQTAAGNVEPVVMIVDADGAGERELCRLEGRTSRGRGVEQRVRWSPDGKLVAVSGYLPQPGMSQQILLVPVDGGPRRTLNAPRRVGLLSAVAWEDAGTLVYSQSLSVSGNSAGSAAQLVRQRLSDGVTTTLSWTPESSFVVERWPGRGLVYDARSARTNLREVSLRDGRSLPLSQGSSTDRQPRLAGSRVLFTSNRGLDLDIWMLDRSRGVSQRLTDDRSEDWDPAMTPDGRLMLWSSNRSGTFEIWGADADGGNPRQISRDGVDAENPTATPDGRWIIYASTAPGRAGVWRIRPDGSDAAKLVADGILPEASPDGRFVLFQQNRSPQEAVIGVAQIADGRRLPFEIRVPVISLGQAVLGRARWMPDGRAIAFVGQDASGASGVFVQPFSPDDPAADTSAARRPLAGFDRERSTESFDVGVDVVVLAESERRSDILGLTGLPR
jgi:eukaryotic-like serine/threonine-protein kinase